MASVDIQTNNASQGPPPHVVAAGGYGASLDDPLQARVADLPPAWRAVVQHSAKTDEERARLRQHREALGVFLSVVVGTQCARHGMGVQGFPPVDRGLLQAEIGVVEVALQVDDKTGAAQLFPAALSMFCGEQIQRWAAVAREQQAQQLQPQRAKILTPGPGFAGVEREALNREERRRRGTGRRV